MFGGIEIAEYKLIVYFCINVLTFLVLALAVGVWLYMIVTAKNKKERAHINKLKERAQTDAVAAGKLAKIERRAKRRRKRNRASLVTEICVMVLAGVLGIALLVGIAVPLAVDYICKDYVVYTGDFVVTRSNRRPLIELEDGTVLSGRVGFDRGAHHGTIVYAKRSKIALGGE